MGIVHTYTSMSISAERLPMVGFPPHSRGILPRNHTSKFRTSSACFWMNSRRGSTWSPIRTPTRKIRQFLSWFTLLPARQWTHSHAAAMGNAEVAGPVVAGFNHVEDLLVVGRRAHSGQAN